MSDINLHKIFRTLVDDESFLSTVIPITKKNETKKKKFDITNNIVNEYNILNAFDVQSSSLFPKDVRDIIGTKYVRIGIVNMMEKNMNNINISFLNSLNQLIRPETRHLSIEEHCKNVALLENFIIHKMQRNYNIDRIKKTKASNIKNKELIGMLENGKICHETIQYIVNIFEINLIVFDFIKSEHRLYWTHGMKFPYFNLFRPLHIIAYVNGNYEPITYVGKNNSPKDEHKKIYCRLLCNLNKFILEEDLKMHYSSLPYLMSWDENLMSGRDFDRIIISMFKDPIVSFEKIKKDTLLLEKLSLEKD